MKPMLMRSGLTDRIFIVTRYKDLGEGRFRAITKYEVTDAELEACGLDAAAERRATVERIREWLAAFPPAWTGKGVKGRPALDRADLIAEWDDWRAILDAEAER